MHTIESTMFDEPSGNVRGVANLKIQFRGKEKRIAHTTILVGINAEILIDLPKKISAGEVTLVTTALMEFASKVKELEAN